MLSKSASWKLGIIVAALIIGGVFGERLLFHPTATSNNSSFPYFDYVVVVVLENANLNQTYGNSCVGNCSYITELANAYGIAENYSAVAHRSLPNYLTLTSGGNYAYSPFMTQCSPQDDSCSIATRNIIDAIEATQRTWRVYIENFGSGCKGTEVPFVYYTDFFYNATRCSRIVDANPGHHKLFDAIPNRLLSDLNSVATAPNFMWLTPSTCDLGYAVCNSTSVIPFSCPKMFSQCVSQANEYLSLLVPKVLNSTIFRTQNAVLFITWDEGAGNVVSNGKICPGDGPTYPLCIDRVTTILAGPHIKHGFASNTSFSHYSFVRTLEVAWNFPPFTSLDAKAIPLTDFFETPPNGSSEQRQPLIDWTLADRICRYE